jgi:hypothetical protein
MSVTETGRRFNIAPPPPGQFEELDKAAETYNKVLADRKATGRRLGGLRGERERAVAEDRALLAQAIKEGKKEPTPSRVAKIDKEIEACERRMEALEEALESAVGDLILVVDEHRDAWAEDAFAQVVEAQAEYADAVATLDVAAQALHAKLALLRFVRLFPDGESSYKVRGSFVLSLRGTNGDPYALHDVLGALREDAQIEFDPSAWRTRDPHGAAVQERFEEQRANELKGLGYLTNAQVAEGLTPELLRQGL